MLLNRGDSASLLHTIDEERGILTLYAGKDKGKLVRHQSKNWVGYMGHMGNFRDQGFMHKPLSGCRKKNVKAVWMWSKIEGLVTANAKRAQLLLKTDVDGSAWTDAKIAEAFNCRVQTIENLRKRVVTEGFEAGLSGKERQGPPTPPKLDGQGQAKLIAMRLGRPPAGYGRWTLRLLANALVTLKVVDAICPETVRQTLKKT